MSKNINKIWDYDRLSKFKMLFTTAIIVWSLHNTLAQIQDSISTKNDNNIVNTQTAKEKLNQDMLNAINIELDKLNENNYSKIIDNIQKAVSFAYDVESDNIFIKRWRVPYSIKNFKDDVKKYSGKIWYKATEISENWENIYISLESEYLMNKPQKQQN